MFCANCGKAYDADDKLCKQCGQPVLSARVQEGTAVEPVLAGPSPTGNVAASFPADSVQTSGGQPGSSLPPVLNNAPPYAVFVSQILASALCGSVVVFNITDDFVRGRWHSTAPTGIAAAIALTVTYLALKSWVKIRESDGENDVTRRRKLLSSCIAFSLLFLATAAIVSAAIGISGKEEAQMKADSKELPTVVDRISRARKATGRTIPARIARYKSIVCFRQLTGQSFN